MQNKFREDVEPEVPEPEILGETGFSRRSLLKLLFSSELLPKEKALAFLPYFFFLAFLCMIYIANRLNAEKNVRMVSKLGKEIKELKWDYMSTKADLMFQSKQSEVANHAIQYGIKESIEPPKKIIVQQ